MPRRAHAHNTHPMSYGAMHALRAGGSAGRAEAQQLIGEQVECWRNDQPVRNVVASG